MRSLPGGLPRWAGISLLVVVSAKYPHAQDEWTVTDLGTPEEQIESLTTSIIALVEEGSLKSGPANGLMRPLQNALRSVAAGRPASACSQLSDFLAEVSRKVLDGALTPAEGAALSEAATSIRSPLGC